MKKPAKGLIGGYATETLDDEERRLLFEAACEDQEVFDALVDEEPLRELLRDTAARRELLAALEQQTLADRLQAWFRQPATLGHLAAVAGVVLAAVIGWQIVAPPIPGPREAARSSDLREALFALRPNVTLPATLEGDPPRFRFTVGRDARVVVVERRPDGAFDQIFPSPGASSAVAPGTSTEATATLVPGAHRVRLIVFPPDVEPLSLDSSSLFAVEARLTVIERTYRVGPGGQIQ